MKKTLFISMLFAAALAFSCAKEINPAAPNTSEETVAQEFTATREALISNDTKAAFSDKSLLWAVGDSIIVSDGTTSSKFIAKEVNEGVATFSLKTGETPLATSGVTYKAYYPCYLAPVEGVIYYPQTIIALNGPTPEGKAANYSPNIYPGIPMYCESQTSSLAFKNLSALLKITVTTPSDDAISEIIARTNGAALSGEATIVNGKLVINSGEEGRASIKNTNAKYTSAVSEYYLPVPEGEYDNFSFFVHSNVNSLGYRWQERKLKTGKTLTVQRGVMYSYTFDADDLHYEPTEDNKTANCYTVIKPSTGSLKYRFLATRGNETEVIEGIDHADVLWKAQAYNSSDMKNKVITNVSYKDGYIMFNLMNNQGNAVIAAYDSSNNIIWSWHIWCLDAANPLKNVTINGVTFLDRNIGALYNNIYGSSTKSSLLTSGYIYQWGRKDPFPGRGQEENPYVAIKIFDKDGNYTDMNQLHTDNRAFGPTTIAGPETIANSIKNPHKYIINESGKWTDESEATWAGDSKTLYDPCPYGYRVAAYSDFSNWNSTNISMVVTTFATSKQCVAGVNYTDGTNTAFLPVTGQMQYNTGKLAGAYVGSTSTVSSKAEANLRIWTRDSDQRYMQANPVKAANKTFEETSLSVTTGTVNKPYGFAVRCVKEAAE